MYDATHRWAKKQTVFRGPKNKNKVAEQGETPIDLTSLPLTAQQKLAVYQRRLDRLFVARVQQEVVRHTEQVLMPYYQERLEKADALLAEGMYKPVFNNTEYRLIWSALHPDSSPDRRAAAFTLFKKNELRLRGGDKPLASGLPKTVAKLLAGRGKKT
jgi:hypothetical protein